MNAEQIKVFYQTLFGATGPLAAVLVQTFGFAPDKVNAWLSLLALLTPILAGAWMAASRTNKAQATAFANMPAEEKSFAVSQLPIPAQAQIAASLSDKAVAAAVATLSPASQTTIATAAVAAMPAAAQAKVADVLSDEAKIAAVTAMPDVTKVVVKDNSKNGVGMALANTAEPKVVPQSAG